MINLIATNEGTSYTGSQRSKVLSRVHSQYVQLAFTELNTSASTEDSLLTSKELYRTVR